MAAIGLLVYVHHPAYAQAQTYSIQDQIDAAHPGETIQLQEGEYNEPIIIDKPIHLAGAENVTLQHKGAEPVLTIKTDEAVIEKLHIKHENNQEESPAILIHGHHNSLHHINIDTSSFGVQLDQANDNTLSSIHISGDKNRRIKDRQHGIDIWKSDRNEIRDTTIRHVQDGMYVEKSNETKLKHNSVFASRYGYHLMFTKNTVLKNNKSHENISGMMVMGADGTIVEDNTLANNRENVQSLGLLVFDTTNAVITENNIVHNRIGILLEDASDNLLASNYIHENYLGLQFKNAENNQISTNSFVANVVQGQAKDSSNNLTNQNYWGDHAGLDITGNQTSNLPYTVDPFFLHITQEYPPFQLLFQSPGMMFLEQLMHTPADQQLVDSSPLMKNPAAVSKNLSQHHPFMMLFICMTLLIFSLFMIYLGVKKNEKM